MAEEPDRDAGETAGDTEDDPASDGSTPPDVDEDPSEDTVSDRSTAEDTGGEPDDEVVDESDDDRPRIGDQATDDGPSGGLEKVDDGSDPRPDPDAETDPAGEGGAGTAERSEEQFGPVNDPSEGQFGPTNGPPDADGSPDEETFDPGESPHGDASEADSWDEFNEMADPGDAVHPMDDPMRTPRPEDPDEFAEEYGDEVLDDALDEESSTADAPTSPNPDGDLVTENPPGPEPADPEATRPETADPEGEFDDNYDMVDTEVAGLDPAEGPFSDAIEDTTGPETDEGFEQPPDDEEMPLAVHVEEMVKRLGIVVVTAGVVSVASYPFTEGLLLTIWNGVLPTGDAPPPHLFGPLEKIIVQIKVAGLIGLVAGLPMLVYQSYRFMRPGLYPHERRYYLAAVPTSLVLAGIGMAFSYFLVLPALFVYFLYYSQGSADVIAFGLAKTFELILTLLGLLAVVFQIPLFIMLAIMMGVTSRRWLEDKRIYFWGAFLGIAFLFAPDPTGMAPFIVAITEIALFEGTLLLLRWVGR